MTSHDETRTHQRAMERHAGTTNAELQKLGKSLEEQNRVQSQIAAGQQKIANLTQQQVALQSAMLDVQRRQLAVQEQTLVVTQLQLEQTQLQTLMQQVALIQRQRQRELKEAAFSIRRRLDQLRDDRDPLRGYVLVTLELRDAEAAGLIPSELEEITDKEYAEASLKALRDTKDATAGKLTAQDLGLLKELSTYAHLSDALAGVRRRLKEFEDDAKEEAKAHWEEKERATNTSTMAITVGVCSAGAGIGIMMSDLPSGLGGFCLVVGIGLCLLGAAESNTSTRGHVSPHSVDELAEVNESLKQTERLLAELKPRRDAAVTRVPELARW